MKSQAQQLPGVMLSQQCCQATSASFITQQNVKTTNYNLYMYVERAQTHTFLFGSLEKGAYGLLSLICSVKLAC